MAETAIVVKGVRNLVLSDGPRGEHGLGPSVTGWWIAAPQPCAHRPHVNCPTGPLVKLCVYGDVIIPLCQLADPLRNASSAMDRMRGRGNRHSVRLSWEYSEAAGLVRSSLTPPGRGPDRESAHRIKTRRPCLGWREEWFDGSMWDRQGSSQDRRLPAGCNGRWHGCARSHLFPATLADAQGGRKLPVLSRRRLCRNPSRMIWTAAAPIAYPGCST